MQIVAPHHAHINKNKKTKGVSSKCPGTAKTTAAEGSATHPNPPSHPQIVSLSDMPSFSCIVAALGALSASMMHISSFYPSLCPMLFHFKVIVFPCVATKPFFFSPPHAAFSIACSSPKHQSKPLSGMQKRILITDIWRSRNTAKSPSLRSPRMLWTLCGWREGV